MANAAIIDSTATNPGGTGSTITVTLPTHAVGDIVYISIGNTGNVLWTGNPAGWNRVNQSQIGTATTGLVGTWFWRKVASGDSLPLASPVFTLGATVTRMATARTLRGPDLEGAFTLPEWTARAYNSGTGNPVRPATITTPAPEGLVLLDYFQRAATNAPDQSGYTQDEEIIISGTLVGNATNKVVADQRTALANQDASPTSGARWVAGIVCVPSADYVYYRAGSSAFAASGTGVTPVLPTGTSVSDNRGNKDLLIATVECAGTPTIAPNTPADWTEVAAFSTTTSGGGTTVRKYYTLYDGTLDRQFNRSTAGEIYVYLSTYRNAHQTTPLGNAAVQSNASSTSSAWPALARAFTKSTVQATCIADGTPTFTSPGSWVERNNGQGTTCADQSYNADSVVSSESFTLSTASPTAAGLLELASVSSADAGSPSSSPSPSLSPSASVSPSASISPSSSPSASLSPSSSPSPSVSPSSSASPSAPPSTEFVIATFTRATDVALSGYSPEVGGPFVDHPHANYAGSALIVDAATDRLYGTATDACYATATPPSADYAVSADFHHVSTIAVNIAICARMDVTADTMYLARFTDGTSWALRKIVAGTPATLGTSTNQIPSVGNFKRGTLVVEGDQISFYVEGTLEIGPITDTSISAAGKVGVRSVGVSSPSTGMHLDNLRADELAAGTVAWGHVTGVTEDQTRSFASHWTGTGTAAGADDAETLCLSAGETMDSEVVNTGAVAVKLLLNAYAAGDTPALKFRHGATRAACEAASWTAYTGPFTSLGYVQVRLESTL